MPDNTLNETNEIEAQEQVEAPEVDEQDQGDDQPQADSSEMFPREYVEKLRRESAGYRERAKRADELAARLHVALVAADGRLADPEDLPFDEAHIDDPEALSAAIGALVDRKPGLRARSVAGDVGVGNRGDSKAGSVDLISMIRGG